jgi:hypothetical protein
MAQIRTVLVRHDFGRVLSEVTAQEAVAYWTNEEQNGVTVRTDNLPKSRTLRFYNAEIVGVETLDTLF